MQVVGFEQRQQDYPATLTLRFTSDAERAEFLSQLSDGWGEDYVSLWWKSETEAVTEADIVLVDVLEDRTDDYDYPNVDDADDEPYGYDALTPEDLAEIAELMRESSVNGETAQAVYDAGGDPATGEMPGHPN